MKRIRYIMPVESMSGLLGTKQDLRYPTDNNKAFDAPADKVSYATNYQPGVVAARVARTGLKYFAIKTKSAFKATAAALRQCALMGATSAIYGISIKDATKLIALEAAYSLAVADGFEGTFHKFCHEQIMNALALGAATIVVTYGTASVNLGNNPFSNASTAIAISSKLLIKFWKQLTPSARVFTIGGLKVIAAGEMSYDQIVANTRINVQNITLQHVGDEDYPKIDAKWIVDAEGNYDYGNTALPDGAIRYLTDVAPSA